MMRDYEFTCIIRSGMEEPDQTALVDRLKGLVTDNGGEVVRTDMWGTRRLAYSIGNRREGQYMFMLVKLPPQALTPIARGVNMIEDVMRHLLVRVEE